MQNRVTVTVGGMSYNLLAAEGEDYIRKVAAYVDDKMKETAEGGRISQLDCAILTAMNIADERFKEQEASENLRRQCKELMEESSKAKMELSEAKREIFKLQQKR